MDPVTASQVAAAAAAATDPYGTGTAPFPNNAANMHASAGTAIPAGKTSYEGLYDLILDPAGIGRSYM